MNRRPKVIDYVVKNDLCIGCGICTAICPENALKMGWDHSGFLVPNQIGNCNQDNSCISVCPFNPYPENEIKTENELSNKFLKDAQLSHPKIGKYSEIYAGHSKEFRITSSSGGMATYFFAELLEKGVVNHIFAVKESNQNGIHYEYSISNNREELLSSAKTKYYPVSLDNVFSKIDELNGKIAIAGVACFIKAIRLAQHRNPELIEKIPVLIGIICGGIKSRFFTEYLVDKVGVKISDSLRPDFRIKNLESTAGDYSFGCVDKNTGKQKVIRMRTVGDMWGTGLFKSNACDFCDDVTTELADISFGDAWMQPYVQEGGGTNVIVVRSQLAKHIIKNGIEKKMIFLEQLSLDQFLTSQQGSFNHRHKGLSFRINQAQNQNQLVPPKRFDNQKVPFDFKIVQYFRMRVRKKSLVFWEEKSNSQIFDKKMKFNLGILALATKIYHKNRSISNKFKKKFL